VLRLPKLQQYFLPFMGEVYPPDLWRARVRVPPPTRGRGIGNRQHLSRSPTTGGGFSANSIGRQFATFFGALPCSVSERSGASIDSLFLRLSFTPSHHPQPLFRMLTTDCFASVRARLSVHAQIASHGSLYSGDAKTDNWRSGSRKLLP
jgi:hypothetical protein